MKLADMNQEEIELHLILEKSRQEAEHHDLMRKKNDELLKLMDNLHGDYPDDWNINLDDFVSKKKN